MKVRGRILMILGSLMILAAMLALVLHLTEESRANDAASRIADTLIAEIAQQAQETTSTTDISKLADGESAAVAVLDPAADIRRKLTDPAILTETIDVEYIGYLSIPDLELTLPVVGTYSDEILKTAPARYAGNDGSYGLVIAAHNYSRHFGRISTLGEGSVIYFTDISGTVYSFAVTEQQILAPEDIDGMVNGEYDLTLFTCTPGGADRVTVRCEYQGARSA
jgi:sortase A